MSKTMGHEQICKWFDICPLKKFYQQGKLDKKWVEDYCWGDYSKCVRYEMEEEGLYHSDSMMPDGTIDQRFK